MYLGYVNYIHHEMEIILKEMKETPEHVEILKLQLFNDYDTNNGAMKRQNVHYNNLWRIIIILRNLLPIIFQILSIHFCQYIYKDSNFGYI